MNERHRAVAGSPQVLNELQSLQSTRFGFKKQVPVALLQNCPAGHAWFSRQKNLHNPFTHEFFGAQSPSCRHPRPHDCKAGLQIESKAQCSSSVQGPVAMHLAVVVSQNRPAGQSRFDVHEAYD